VKLDGLLNQLIGMPAYHAADEHLKRSCSKTHNSDWQIAAGSQGVSGVRSEIGLVHVAGDAGSRREFDF